MGRPKKTVAPVGTTHDPIYSNIEKVNEPVIRSMYARGNGVNMFAGGVQILSDDLAIHLSWDKTGKPYIRIYERSNKNEWAFRVGPEYVPIIDEQGQVFTEWPLDEDWPTKPLPRISSEVKNVVRNKKRRNSPTK